MSGSKRKRSKKKVKEVEEKHVPASWRRLIGQDRSWDRGVRSYTVRSQGRKRDQSLADVGFVGGEIGRLKMSTSGWIWSEWMSDGVGLSPRVQSRRLQLPSGLL